MKRALFAISLLLPVACFADHWTKHFDVSGNPELHVFPGNAALEIRSGAGSGIDVELKTEGLSIGPSEVHIEPRQDGNRLELHVYMPEQHFNWGHNSVRVEVRVPRTIATFVQGENGPVTLRELSGTARINSGNGPIEIAGFDGSLESQTGNGPVKVNGRFDAVQLRTGNGPLELAAGTGSRLTASWHVETGNGPVSIRLPQDVRADLSVHTGNGPLSFSLPVENKESDRHNIHGKLNGGGPQLSIDTGDGPVSIGRS